MNSTKHMIVWVVLLLSLAMNSWATKPPRYQSSVIEPGFTFTGFGAYKKASVNFYGSSSSGGIIQSSSVTGSDSERFRADIGYVVGIFDKVELSMVTRFMDYADYYPLAWFTFLVAKDFQVKVNVLNRGDLLPFKNIVLSPYIGGGPFGGYGGVSVGTQFKTPNRKVLGELTCYPNFSVNRYSFDYYYPVEVGYDGVHVTLLQSEIEVPIGFKFTFGSVIRASVYGSVAVMIPLNSWNADDNNRTNNEEWDFYVDPIAASAGFSMHFGSKRSRAALRAKRDAQK